MTESLATTESITLASSLAAGIGFLASAALGGFLTYGWFTRISGRAVLAAAYATMLWQALLLVDRATGNAPGAASQAAEVLAYLLWLIVCLRALGVGLHNLTSFRDAGRSTLLVSTAAVIGAAGGAEVLSLLGSVAPSGLDGGVVSASARLISAIMGLVLLEQIARNTRRSQQWNLKFLVVGLGVPFAYAVVLYADAILFRRTDPALAAMQGLAVALGAPFLAIATLRNRDQRLAVNVSRRLVFHTGALLLTGAYLLLVAAAGYWIRTFGGTWGQLLLIPFVLCAALAGIVLAASRTTRERFERFVMRNLFADKHDYREQWLKISEALQAADPETTLAERALSALGDLVAAHRGAIFRRGRSDVLHPYADVKSDWTMPFTPADSARIIAHFEEAAMPLVVADARLSRSARERSVGESLAALPGAHLVVPLMVSERLWGIAVLTRPETGDPVDGEDEEILSVAARQIASHLAQDEAHQALAEARQLTAFNQMTAFVVHDVKTVIAQLSLMIRNAQTHKSNPEFVDDMIATVENAVSRMQSLLTHLKDPLKATEPASCDVRQLLERVAEQCQTTPPRPQCAPTSPGMAVTGSMDRLLPAIEHLVRNAQEAASSEGHVSISASARDGWVSIRIADDGPGMSEQFVASRLFKPFDSTKGLTGMGIGAWQARETARHLGGDIRITSSPGRGTEVEVLLPSAETRPPDAAPESGNATATIEAGDTGP